MFLPTPKPGRRRLLTFLPLLGQALVLIVVTTAAFATAAFATAAFTTAAFAAETFAEPPPPHEPAPPQRPSAAPT